MEIIASLHLLLTYHVFLLMFSVSSELKFTFVWRTAISTYSIHIAHIASSMETAKAKTVSYERLPENWLVTIETNIFHKKEVF